MSITIVIPTYNRWEILEKNLLSLLNQMHPSHEIIVVDDGTTNETAQRIKTIKNSSIRYLKNKGRGKASALNLGIKEAKGEVILCLDDDIIPNQGLLEEHLKHSEKGIAILGRVVNKAKRKTPFLDYLLNHSAILNGYHLIRNPLDVHYRFCYSSNISFRKDDLMSVGFFSEDFKEYGWEDIELGYRWVMKGFKIRYDAHAQGYHLYDATLDEICKRQKMIGRTATIFYKKHPTAEIRKLLRIDEAKSLTKKSGEVVKIVEKIIPELEEIYSIKANFGARGVRKILHQSYLLVIGYYYYLGINEGLTS